MVARLTSLHRAVVMDGGSGGGKLSMLWRRASPFNMLLAVDGEALAVVGGEGLAVAVTASHTE